MENVKTPEEVVSQLRHYQLDAYEKLIRWKRGLVYDDMRLGKTITTLAACHKLDAYPLLIVCPKFAFYVWQQEIEKWLGMESMIYTGKPKERDLIWKEFVTSGCKILITNYAHIAEISLRSSEKKPTPGTSWHIATPYRTGFDSYWKWNGFIADEIHMGGLFNNKQKTKQGNPSTVAWTERCIKDIPYRFLLTGTPFRQGVVDFYSPLHLVDPNRFTNYYSYVNRWCIQIKDTFGVTIERNPKNIFAFREMINQYMIRRTKEEVFKDMPEKQRQAIPVDMNEEQAAIYWELTENLFTIIPETDEVLLTPGQLALLTRQRQLLACPQILGLKDRGAALDTIVEMSHEQLDNKEPVVIYTPYRQAVPFIEHAFIQEYGKLEVYKIQGKMSAEEFRDSWMGFQNSSGLRIMICVIKSGASFKASKANVGYFLGCEWDFNLNEQAEDRMFDPDDKVSLQVYYILHRGTAEDSVIAKLNDKKGSANWVLSNEEVFKTILEQLKARRGRKKSK
jgi:SNF2 family DNA or RNA helicase